MGRAPCCDKANVKKGPWSPEEDAKLKEYIEKNGTGGNWIALPQKAGLKRCGKSCRLRWLNYLRPNIKHGEFTAEEDRIIFNLYANIGSRWSIIAAQLPGRTDNDIKNYWNTKLKKKLMAMFPPPSQRIMITTNIKPAPNAPTFSSLLPHNPSSSPPSSSSSSSSSLQYHNISSYSPSTTFLSNSNSSNYMISTTAAASPILQPHNTFLCSMQQFQESPCYPAGNFKDVDQFEKMGINNYVSDSGIAGEISYPKFLEFDHVGDLNNNGSSSVDTSSLLDYGLEEIKELIISASTSSFILDEIKREENVMYF